MNVQLVHEKWMAGLAWVAVLVALLVTSFQALAVIAGSGISQLILAYLQNPAGLGSLNGFMIVSIILVVVAAILLLYGWLRYAQVTNEVMIALSSPRDDTEPVFASFLHLSDQQGSEGDADVYEAKGSLFGDMIRLLAIVWVILLIAGPLVSIG